MARAPQCWMSVLVGLDGLGVRLCSWPPDSVLCAQSLRVVNRIVVCYNGWSQEAEARGKLQQRLTATHFTGAILSLALPSFNLFAAGAPVCQGGGSRLQEVRIGVSHAASRCWLT